MREPDRQAPWFEPRAGTQTCTSVQVSVGSYLPTTRGNAMIYRELDDDRETIPVRELLEDSYFTIIGTRGFADADDTPEHGENWFSPRIRNTSYGDDDVEVLEIPVTTWGEYITCSAVERANFNVLVDEYREHVIDAEWFHDTHGIYLRLDREIPADLFDRIMGLADYPLLDDDELNAVEQKLEEEDWDSYGRDDFRRAAERLLDEEYEGERSDHVQDAIDAALDDDAINEAAWAAMNEGTLLWQGETATNGYFSGLDDAARAYAESVIHEIGADFERYALELTRQQADGQLALSV